VSLFDRELQREEKEREREWRKREKEREREREWSGVRESGEKDKFLARCFRAQ